MQQTHQMTNSHILLGRFDYLEPASVEEAIGLLEQSGDDARVLAGGTDLVVRMKMERVRPHAIVSLAGIPTLARIETREGALSIGSGATIAAIERDPRVRHDYPSLADACAGFSTTQVQAMATVGGNICNGSPAADCAPALLVGGAEVEIAGPRATRRLPLEQFFIGPGRTVLENGEILTRIILPPPPAAAGSAFLKLGRVAADVAKASVAVMVIRDGGRIADCRIAFGSVAPTPLRSRRAERTLAGRRFSPEALSEAAEMASLEVSPIDDVRSSAWYRRRAVRALVFDAATLAWERAGAEHVPRAEEVREAEEAPKSARLRRLAAGEKTWIELDVNGRRQRAFVGTNDLLLNVLRGQLELTGSKYGCGIGECSACTVLVDGQPMLACLLLAVSAVGRRILTVEGLSRPNGALDRLQESFLDLAAYQCGYCTPGMLLTAKSLLSVKPRPTEHEVRHYMRGNVCRCTGYARIVRAVLDAAGAGGTSQQ
ncbi:MAG: FAD binding domain-containing protein [Vicinamibacterales bacterium]